METNLAYDMYVPTRVMPTPTMDNVEAGAKVAIENGCGFLVAPGRQEA